MSNEAPIPTPAAPPPPTAAETTAAPPPAEAAPVEPQAPSSAGEPTASTAFDIEERRRLKNESYVTSGCGKNKEKDRVVGTFWDVVWPALAKQGWKKVDGQGSDKGLTYFYPKGVEAGVKGRDYYDRIKDVLDRLREKRTDAEGAVIEDFDAECYSREREETKSSRKRKANDTAASPKKTAKADSWKEGRKFTKKTSRVGPNYQPSSIPKVGEKPAVEEEIPVLWKVEDAVEAGTPLKTIESALQDVPPNKKFDVLCSLAEQGYKVDEGIDNIVENVPLTDGSDWDAAKKKQFSQEIFKNRKDLSQVCKNMGIEMKTCLIYYYRAFKNSTDYRLMKAIFDDERYEKTAKFETVYDVCAICGDGGELVICDECEGEYHLKCMRPPLRVVPEGRWECDECVDRKVLQLRNFLLYQTNLAQAPAETEGPEANEEVSPSAETLAAVRQFGKKISELLTPAEVEGEVEVEAEEVVEDDKDTTEVKAEVVEEEDTEMKTEQAVAEKGTTTSGVKAESVAEEKDAEMKEEETVAAAEVEAAGVKKEADKKDTNMDTTDDVVI